MENILPQKDKWIAYGGKDSTRTERALLRHTLNHLHQLLDDDRDRSFPEEMYLHPPLTENLRTGSIIKSAEGDKYHIVVSPACDLAIRDDGNINTDRILLAEIEESSRIIEIALRKCSTSGEKQDKLMAVCGNNYTTYLHWLPQTMFFGGGFVNFRKLRSYKKKEINKGFDKPIMQISPSFVKDIMGRLSSYYARQGQPDLDNGEFISINALAE